MNCGVVYRQGKLSGRVKYAIMSSPVDDINAILEKYILPRNDAEHRRLEMQHNYLLTTVYDGRLIYDKELQLKPGSRVLDAGTGAGSWILALAKEVPDSVELVGVDVSLAMFPESFPSNVHLVEASTTNLPDSWTNSFDFVHQRLMICAFTASDWSRAISEIFRALKPGGTAQIVEISAPFPSGENLKKAEKLTTLYTDALRSRVYLYNLADDIPKIMEKAGFVDIREEIRGAPVGNKWGEIGRIGADNFTTAFRSCSSFAVAEGGFGLVKSPEDVDALFEAGRKELDEVEGVCYNFAVILARKPL